MLEAVPATLSDLTLLATESKKPHLAPIARLKSLRKLYIEGHHKSIELLNDLGELEDLSLRSITTPDLRYLEKLNRPWSLDIKLIGIRSFAGIENKATIRCFELWQVRAVRDVDVVAQLLGLQDGRLPAAFAIARRIVDGANATNGEATVVTLDADRVDLPDEEKIDAEPDQYRCNDIAFVALKPAQLQPLQAMKRQPDKQDHQSDCGDCHREAHRREHGPG